MATNCFTCIGYTETSGLYKDSPRGLCTNETPMKAVNPEDGLNCSRWRPKETGVTPALPPVGETPPMPPVKPYPIPPKPISLEQQVSSEEALKENDILKISFKDEWLVSAIGKKAILAMNPRTNIERAFSDAEFQFERLRR